MQELAWGPVTWLAEISTLVPRLHAWVSLKAVVKMSDLFSVEAGEGSVVRHTGSCHKHIFHHIPYLIIKSL